MRYVLLVLSFALMSIPSFSQNKKKMDVSTYELWKQIDQKMISPDGDWVVYQTKQIKADPDLHIYNTRTKETKTIHRGANPKFDYQGGFLAYVVKPSVDSVRTWKREKKKKDEFGKDTLHVFKLKSQESISFPDIESYKLPEKWGSVLCFEQKVKIDSSKKKTTQLVIWNVASTALDTIAHIVDYKFAEETNQLVYAAGKEKAEKSNISMLNCINKRSSKIMDYTGYCKQLTISNNASAIAAVINQDTLDTKPVKGTMFLWQANKRRTNEINLGTSNTTPKNFYISPDRNISFSKDGKRVFFGTRPLPLVQDTSLIEEEIVDVEVWTYKDQTLYTQQENNSKNDKKKSYLACYHIVSNAVVQLEDKSVSRVRMDEDRMVDLTLATDDQSYRMSITHLGYPYHDVYVQDVSTGKRKKVLTKEPGNFGMSPSGKYARWFNGEEQSWKTIELAKGKVNVLTDSNQKFADELNDRPMDPWPYGTAFWIEGDDQLVINDRYDLWLFSADGSESKRLTKGREQKKVYRYIDLNKEDRFEKTDSKILLHVFDETDKSSGYAQLDLKDGTLSTIEHGGFSYTKNVMKARLSEDVVFTKENFDQFPNLTHTQLDGFKNQSLFSNANPQQNEYRWGDIELIKWTSHSGKELEGLLVKPDDFDPKKKYPVLVNFYERSSNGLHRHRAPFPHRSTINYSYYVNRGYVIFNPNVHYDIGYPGKSCEDAVLSGVEKLKSFDWVDQDNIGVQGHSWGGYQIAHLLTKTDVFKCAEAGAPVVNMISAYGGIRWGSGMSRMFQYEKTQSRLGGTLWETPELYLENSPIFNIDKVNTPVLILHNDKDGAVPWYQGIEYFVALRRLDKPSWFLNYNNEPHWPVKLQNRLDFNKRMQQFFDHYLMDQPMPRWMHEGIPAINKSIDQGYELLDVKR